VACLDENTIVEFIQGTMSLRDARAVEEHVDSCAACRQLLAELARTSFALLSPEVSSSESGLGDATLPPGDESMPTGSGGSMEGLRAGQVIAGRYRVVRFLGKGAMGRVYEVDDMQLQDRVALKLLRPEVRDVPRLLQHLRHEVVLGRRISHPNVCRLHDIGSFGGNHFITMSLVHGENLTSILSREVPPPDWAMGVLLQICAALEAAHEQGVVHRDLKSSNIMVDAKGKVTVMDFGLARDLWGEPSQSGMLIGSPAYWSPEQACGQRATERSDIYSFGVVACELFGARRPLLGSDVDLGRIPAAFRPAITRCLQAKAEERFGSVAEVRQALAAARDRPPHPRRWGLVAAGLVLALLAVGGALAYLLWPGQPAPTPPELARAVSPVSARSPDLGAFAAVNHDASPTMVFAPDRVQRPAPPHGRAPRRPRPHAAPAPSPAPRPDAAPPTAAPVLEAEALRRALEQRLEQLEARRVKAGILVLDSPAYDRALAEAKQALAAKDTIEARLAEARAAAVLDRTRIDKAFIARKLARLTRLKGARKLDEARAKEVHATFAKVHGSYFAGDYNTANIHLNRLWQLLRR